MVHDVVELDRAVVGGRRDEVVDDRRGVEGCRRAVRQEVEGRGPRRAPRPAARRNARANRGTSAGLLLRPGRARHARALRNAPGTAWASSWSRGAGRRLPAPRLPRPCARARSASRSSAPAIEEVAAAEQQVEGFGAACVRGGCRRQQVGRDEGIEARKGVAGPVGGTAQAGWATRSSCSRRSRPGPNSRAAPAHSRRARAHHSAGASCSDGSPVVQQARNGFEPRGCQVEALRQWRKGPQQEAEDTEHRLAGMQARVAPGEVGRRRLPGLDFEKAFGKLTIHALRARSAARRQRAQPSQQPRRLGGQVRAPRLRKIRQSIVVRMHPDERGVHRPPAVIRLKERIQPAGERGRPRRDLRSTPQMSAVEREPAPFSQGEGTRGCQWLTPPPLSGSAAGQPSGVGGTTARRR